MEYYDEVVEIKNKPKRLPSQRNPDQSNSSSEIPSIERKKLGPPSIPSVDDSERTTSKRPQSSLPRRSGEKVERVSSDSESSDSDTDDHAKTAVDGFDYKQWESLNVSADLKELYQYIARYVN